MKNIVLSLTLLFVYLTNVSAQTSVSGGIYQNTTWTLAGSPYLVTGSIVVFPNRTLTIEPGVEVIVSADYSFNTGNYLYLEVRGSLIANGTINAPIVITSSDTSLGFYNWEGIRIKGSQGGNVQMNYFELHNSFYGIYNDIAQVGVTYTFDHCLFRSNNYALQLNAELVYNNCTFQSNAVGQATQLIGGSMTANNTQFINNFCSVAYSGYINLNNCNFIGNQNNLIGSPGTVTNCQFINNAFGFMETGGITVTNCLFDGNTTGIEGTYSCNINNNTFINNGIALKMGDACNVSQNEINNNDIGIQVLAYDPNTTQINDNSICYNSIHNLENLTDRNYQVNLNCFCSQDSTVIENGIYDGYDDITRGLVNYAIYDDSCQTILNYVSKVNLGSAQLDELDNDWTTWFDGSAIHVNLKQASDLKIYSANGMVLWTGTISEGKHLVQTSLSPGIYWLTNGLSTQKIYVSF